MKVPRLRPPTIFLFGALAALAFGGARVAAQEIRLYSGDIAPYSYLMDGRGTGFMYDIVREAARVVGNPAEIEFLPWTRAQKLVQSEPLSALIPLSRIPQREHSYSWVFNVIDEPLVLLALTGSDVDISSERAARNLLIGAMRSTPMETLLDEAGFPNVSVVVDESANALMLHDGRIDAWLVGPLAGEFYYRRNGLDWNEVRVGATLSVIHLGMAASKDMDPAILRAWRSAFEKVKLVGTFDHIMEKYGMRKYKLR